MHIHFIILKIFSLLHQKGFDKYLVGTKLISTCFFFVTISFIKWCVPNLYIFSSGMKHEIADKHFASILSQYKHTIFGLSIFLTNSIWLESMHIISVVANDKLLYSPSVNQLSVFLQFKRSDWSLTSPICIWIYMLTWVALIWLLILIWDIIESFWLKPNQ